MDSFFEALNQPFSGGPAPAVRGLTRWGVSRTPPHPQSAEQKGAEEHDNADEEQEQQAFSDDTYDA
jgi:hypothetical protein